MDRSWIDPDRWHTITMTCRNRAVETPNQDAMARVLVSFSPKKTHQLIKSIKSNLLK